MDILTSDYKADIIFDEGLYPWVNNMPSQARIDSLYSVDDKITITNDDIILDNYDDINTSNKINGENNGIINNNDENEVEISFSNSKVDEEDNDNIITTRNNDDENEVEISFSNSEGDDNNEDNTDDICIPDN